MHVIKGKATWAKVYEPDTRFVKEGLYSINVSIPEAEASAICEQFEDALKEYADKLVKDNPKIKNVLSIRKPFETEYDDNGDETGCILFKPKNKAQITARDGKTYTRTVAVVDAKRNPLDKSTLIGNGSTVKVAFEAAPYYLATDKVAGLSLRLKAVQVLELVSYSKGTDAFFDEEEGFVSEAVAKDDKTDFFAEDTGTASDEGDF